MPKPRIMIVGAHPDDCEFRCGGVSALWRGRGFDVGFVSLTNGQSGHHEQGGAVLVQRRMHEAHAAAGLIGAQCFILPLPDGHLEPTLENRLMLIRLIRSYAPDLILTNRPNDYHPDHRYTSQLVQDAAFSLTVPHIAAETTALRRVPVILYWWDYFQKPAPFQVDLAIDVDATFDTKIAMLDKHESQMYEWLPWLEGTLDQVPRDHRKRRAWLKEGYATIHTPSIADCCRAKLIERYGQTRGGNVREAEAFEMCEYGAKLDAAQLRRLFADM